jgi:ureidoglycolate lyase
MTITLKPEPLSAERFAPYGEVIETSRGGADAMNAARFERFDDLCNVDLIDDGRISVSIARCRTPSSLPLRLDMVERHPLGSQAFIPLSPCKMVIVVAPPAESVDAQDLRAFVTNGRQGFNYRRGTWHMPLVSFAAGQEYLIIDRGGSASNCEEHTLDDVIYLEDA